MYEIVLCLVIPCLMAGTLLFALHQKGRGRACFKIPSLASFFIDAEDHIEKP